MNRPYLRERRAGPRIPVALDGSLGGLSVCTMNLSIGGALVSCERTAPERLEAHLESRDTRFDLWLPGGRHVGIEVTVVHVLTRDDECLIGLAFRRFEADGLALLRAFVLRRAGPDSVGGSVE